MAINVGVTSLLVMMATVVVVLPLGLTLGRVLLNKLGLMTGVKVRCLLLAAAEDDEAEASDEEPRVKSLSRSAKSSESDEASRVGVTEALTLVGSISPDSISGVEVVG